MLNRIRIRLQLAARKQYGSNRIKYILEKHRKSSVLVVVFSGFSAAGEPAKFNYLRTLAGKAVNKLFILDDFGYQNRGSYYLTGREGAGPLQEEICSLIEACRKGKTLIMAGSSKGGSAALLYGFQCGADAVIVGAPQYHIGSYLMEDCHRSILEGICGEASEETAAKLNRLLPEQMDRADREKTEVWIHCSPREHTFEEHVQDLLRDLKEKGFRVQTDLDERYSEHSKVGHYYSEYLKKSLAQLTGTQ